MSLYSERAVQYRGKSSVANNLRQFVAVFDSLCSYYSAGNSAFLAK